MCGKSDLVLGQRCSYCIETRSLTVTMGNETVLVWANTVLTALIHGTWQWPWVTKLSWFGPTLYLPHRDTELDSDPRWRNGPGLGQHCTYRIETHSLTVTLGDETVLVWANYVPTASRHGAWQWPWVTKLSWFGGMTWLRVAPTPSSISPASLGLRSGVTVIRSPEEWVWTN